MAKTGSEGNQSKRNKKRKITVRELFMGGMALVLIVAVIALFIPRNPPVTTKPVPSIKEEKTTAQPEITFRIDGLLRFLDSDRSTIKTEIDLEIAKTLFERNRGLMYRRSMPANGGMLFIFEIMGPQSFWMKNTVLPLDIIYVNDQFGIVSIAEHTRPYSLEPIKSGGPAKYVVEVHAGYCQANGITAGDYIEFDRF